MKNRKRYFNLFFVVLLFFVTGCSMKAVEIGEADIVEEVVAEEVEPDAYQEAIETGKEELVNENYEQALESFKMALEIKFDDEDLVVWIIQLEQYIEATKLYEQELYEESRIQLAAVQSHKNGLNQLSKRAEVLLDEIERIELAIKEEQEEKEAAEVAKKAEEEAKAAEIARQEAEIEAQKNAYSYNDFVGYYLHFSSGDRSHSDMITTIGNDYMTIGWWMSEFELYDILSYSIHENILTIDYYLNPYYEGPGDYGSMTLALREDNGQSYLDFGSDMPFYKATYDEVVNYEYSIQEFLYEDIHR